MTVLAIEREIGYVDLARASKNSGRIPGNVSIEAHFGLCHDGHSEIAFGTGECFVDSSSSSNSNSNSMLLDDESLMESSRFVDARFGCVVPLLRNKLTCCRAQYRATKSVLPAS